MKKELMNKINAVMVSGNTADISSDLITEIKVGISAEMHSEVYIKNDDIRLIIKTFIDKGCKAPEMSLRKANRATLIDMLGDIVKHDFTKTEEETVADDNSV